MIELSVLESAVVVVCAAILAYTYVGYPALLIALRPAGRRSTNGRPDSEATPTCAVLLVVRNEAGEIDDRIANLLDQSPSGIVERVVVVSDGSTDQTGEIVRSWSERDARVVFVEQEPSGKAAGINTAMAMIESDIVVFADARQRFRGEAVDLLLAGFGDPEVGGVAGRLEYDDDGVSHRGSTALESYWSYEVWVRKLESRFHSLIGVSGAIHAIRRSLCPPLPAGLILDDVFIPMSVTAQGYRVVFEPNATAVDTHVGPARDYRRRVRTAAGNWQIMVDCRHLLAGLPMRDWWCFVSHKLLRVFGPFAVVLLALVLAVAAGRAYPWPIVSAVVVAALLVMLATWLPAGALDPLRQALRKVVAMNFANAVGTWKYWRGQTDSLWMR